MTFYSIDVRVVTGRTRVIRPSVDLEVNRKQQYETERKNISNCSPSDTYWRQRRIRYNTRSFTIWVAGGMRSSAHIHIHTHTYSQTTICLTETTSTTVSQYRTKILCIQSAEWLRWVQFEYVVADNHTENEARCIDCYWCSYSMSTAQLIVWQMLFFNLKSLSTWKPWSDDSLTENYLPPQSHTSLV